MSMCAPSPVVDSKTIIADLAPSDQRLGLTCNYCGRFRYMADRRFPSQMQVSAVAQSLSCMRCGSTDVETRAISRDPKNGYWPAEHS